VQTLTSWRSISRTFASWNKHHIKWHLAKYFPLHYTSSCHNSPCTLLSEANKN